MHRLCSQNHFGRDRKIDSNRTVNTSHTRRYLQSAALRPQQVPNWLVCPSWKDPFRCEYAHSGVSRCPLALSFEASRTGSPCASSSDSKEGLCIADRVSV